MVPPGKKKKSSQRNQTKGRDLTPAEALSLVKRIHKKYAPVLEKLSRKDKIALAKYFLPHSSTKPVIGPTRPRMVKWYCPFASQDDFASGHRYCINVYTGCDHKCVYCYASGYEPTQANIKKNFKKLHSYYHI